MITVAEAKQTIKESCKASEPRRLTLEEAAGLVLAQEVIAPYNIPSFYQSSMDGYAIAFDDVNVDGTLRIVGESAAGNSTRLSLQPGEACRIFTGAGLPAGADTIVIQEKTSISNGLLTINDPSLKYGQFVRSIGAEILSGQIALPAHHELSPASVSYLAAIGIVEVLVYPLPVVTIIVTGNEFQLPGVAPEYGRVFESNSAGLKAVLSKAGIRNVQVVYVGDALAPTTAALENALAGSDLVLLTGGVSVGDYDFVVAAAKACGIETCFHKIRQKPGKPLYFGLKNNVPVFGLPGNPSSVLTCFYEYVLLAIETLCRLPLALKVTRACLRERIEKPAGLTHFMKAFVANGEIRALNAQESFRLSSFAKANCLLLVPEETTTVNVGDEVELHMLP